MQTSVLRTAVRVLGQLALLLALTHPAAGTIIVEKDLDALCSESDFIFIGTVSAVRSGWADRWEDHIETLVTFSEIEPLYRIDSSEVVLRFSGGEVGDIVERVQGMPTFRVGERVVIFARDEFSVSPLVGFNQGCGRVSGDGDEGTVSMTSYRQAGVSAGGRRLLTGAPEVMVTVPLRDFVADVQRRLHARETRQ